MIAHFMAQRLGGVTAGVLGLVPPRCAPADHRQLARRFAEPLGHNLCYDHSRPISGTNKHQRGMVTLLDDAALDAVVNVDFWRFLMTFEPNKLVEESLRVARELILVQTQETRSLEELMSSCTTIDYVADMLGRGRTVTSATIDGADVLRIK